MNRPIKFRVWDNKKKIWLDKTDFCIYNGDAQEVEIGGTEYLYNGSSYNPLKFVENDIGGLYCNRNLIIQQYTGLTDSKETEICEGDILEWKGEFIAEVFFEQENAAFVIKSKKGGKAFMSENYVLNFQIIGNIFEHKHLLEK